MIDIFCVCQQGGKGHHSTHTPPRSKKQHRQPTAQHSTARRCTTGHGRAKHAQTAPQNDSRATTAQHHATAQRHSTRHREAGHHSQHSKAEQRTEQRRQGTHSTGEKAPHYADTTTGQKTAQPTNSTTQHSMTGHRAARKAPTALQHDSRAQQHSTTRQRSTTEHDTGKQGTTENNTNHRDADQAARQEHRHRNTQPADNHGTPDPAPHHSTPKERAAAVTCALKALSACT